MTYQETLDFLFEQLPMYQRIGRKAFKKDLSNTIELSRLLDDPQEKYPSIHIAGTNGKGTVAHALSSILQEAGYSTGLYTSPHLKSYRERIRMNGQMVTEDFVTNFVKNLQQDITKIQPSFFEITVAMAFSYFAHMKADIAVIETGLGGRLDSTNIIKPTLSIITSIGLDHQDMLGETLELIAKEKAGIIKEETPVVIGQLPPEAQTVMVSRAQELKCKLNCDAELWKIEEQHQGVYVGYKSEQLIYEAILSEIKGNYFKKNLPTIFESCHELNQRGFTLSTENILNGLARVVSNTGLKGRWQKLDESPLMICDIGHNQDGIAETMNNLPGYSYNQLHIVFGTVNDKNLDQIFPLLIKNAIYYFCQAKVPRAMKATILQNEAAKHGLHGDVFDSVNSAIHSAKLNAGPKDLIFIGGSTFVVAEIEDL